MKVLPEVHGSALGLRERKKAKTRAAIQREALRLFREQGYDATTVEQIAEAVEVSPSTFFRYFPTKVDVAMYDDFDPILFEAFHAQPAELSPIQAFRAAIREALSMLPPEEMARQHERAVLILSVPELRMKMLDELFRSVQVLAELVASRVGRQADELAVRAFAGAVIGVSMAATLSGPTGLASDYADLMDRGLAFLEAGLPL
jgi:AcrR family transcriptional regulator